MRIIETSLDEDLSDFSRVLTLRRVPHRVFEERGVQVLELRDDAAAADVRSAYEDWRAGRLRIERVADPGARSRRQLSLAALVAYPGLTAIVLLAVVVYLATLPLWGEFGLQVARWLTFIDPGDQRFPVPREAALQPQIWRWFTPVFLHFTVVHLAFNCAWMVWLGSRVERAGGAMGLWLLVLATGVASNLAQFLWHPQPWFGGLSGVVYGLLGFIVVRARYAPEQPLWRIPTGVTAVLLIFLVLFSTGLTEPFGLNVANAAHWAGLVSGALAALALNIRTNGDRE